MIDVSGATWQHIAVTGDGTAKRIYIDGVEVASQTANTSDYGDSGFGFNIGGGIRDDVAANGNWFDGRIDDVRVYDRALNPAEIVALAQDITQTAHRHAEHRHCGDGR